MTARPARTGRPGPPRPDPADRTNRKESMLELQIQLLTAWWQAADIVGQRLRDARDDDRGEITATTALIVILVVAAIAAGGVIAAKIAATPTTCPTP